MIKHLFITTISIILSISTAFADKSMMIGKKGKQEDVSTKYEVPEFIEKKIKSA